MSEAVQAVILQRLSCGKLEILCRGDAEKPYHTKIACREQPHAGPKPEQAPALPLHGSQLLASHSVKHDAFSDHEGYLSFMPL